MENNNLQFTLPDENAYAQVTDVKPVQISKRSKSTAIILAIIGGAMGIHSFYLGFTKKGIIQLITAMFGISVLWALIDIVCMLFSAKVYDADGNILS